MTVQAVPGGWQEVGGAGAELLPELGCCGRWQGVLLVDIEWGAG